MLRWAHGTTQIVRFLAAGSDQAHGFVPRVSGRVRGPGGFRQRTHFARKGFHIEADWKFQQWASKFHGVQEIVDRGRNRKGGPSPSRPPGLFLAEVYFSSTVPPASSICFLIFSASSLLTPSLTGLGAPSTSAFASPRPRPVIARTSLITLIFLPPSPVRITSNSVFSSAAGAAGPAAAGAAATAAAAETPHFSSSALARSAASRTVRSESWSTSLVMSAI